MLYFMPLEFLREISAIFMHSLSSVGNIMMCIFFFFSFSKQSYFSTCFLRKWNLYDQPVCYLSGTTFSPFQISLELNFQFQPLMREGKVLKAIKDKEVSLKGCKIIIPSWKCTEFSVKNKIKTQQTIHTSKRYCKSIS